MVLYLNEPNLSLLFFGSKSGVGKTTCASAAASVMARLFPAVARYIGGVFGETPLHEVSFRRERDTLREFLKRLKISFDVIKTHFRDSTRFCFVSVMQADELSIRETALLLCTLGASHLSIGAFRTHEQLDSLFLKLACEIPQSIQTARTRDSTVANGRSLRKFRELLTAPERTSVYAVSFLNMMCLDKTRDFMAAFGRMGTISQFFSSTRSFKDIIVYYVIRYIEKRERSEFGSERAFRECTKL